MSFKVEGARSVPGKPGSEAWHATVDLDPLPQREENQEAAGREPAGIELKGQGDASKTTPAPNLDDIPPKDLSDIGRLLDLHRQAVAKGFTSPSEDGWLKFIAAAEHARSIGSVNPPGLFARIVRAGLWRFITQDEVNTARKRQRDHLNSRTKSPIETRAKATAFK